MALQTSLRRRFGFTMVELLITLTIVGVLAALAGPSFRTLTVSQRIKAAGSDLMTSMTLARSEAVKQNGDVTVTPVGGTWDKGWTISGSGGAVKKQSSYSNLTITGPTSITYNRSGRVTTTSILSFQINDSASGSTIQGRCVTLGLTGQPSTKAGSC
jgi:type IV fimbrial biogenesis protein FimT